jgi:hypothetical protein
MTSRLGPLKRKNGLEEENTHCKKENLLKLIEVSEIWKWSPDGWVPFFF